MFKMRARIRESHDEGLLGKIRIGIRRKGWNEGGLWWEIAGIRDGLGDLMLKQGRALMREDWMRQGWDSSKDSLSLERYLITEFIQFCLKFRAGVYMCTVLSGDLWCQTVFLQSLARQYFNLLVQQCSEAECRKVQLQLSLVHIANF